MLIPRTILALPPLVLLLLALSAPAEDWPRWRGPRGDGTWHGPKLPDKWPPDGLKRVWKRPAGGGYAGVTVADGRVYTLDLESPIPPRPKGKADDRPDGTERVLCFDAATGKPLWSYKYPVNYSKFDRLTGYGNGPRAAPTFHEGKLYTLGAVGNLFCLDAKTGEVIWSKDAVRDFDARVPMWGFAASPVIDGERVVVHVGGRPKGCVIALDRGTGKEVWRSLSDPAGYATPVLINARSGRQLVVWTPTHVRGLDPADGRPLWAVPHKEEYGVSIATPIFQEGIVFITGYWEGAKAIRLGPKPEDAELLWQDRRNLRGLMAQPLYRDGHAYSLDRTNGLTCFELKSGKKLWDDDNAMTPKGRNPHASFVWAGDGDKVLSLNTNGELILARFNPKGYQELSRTKVIDGRCWGHPGFAGRFVYVKSDGGEQWGKGPYELACVELPAGE